MTSRTYFNILGTKHAVSFIRAYACVLCSLLLVFIGGCSSKTMIVELATENERVPYPKFLISKPQAKDELPSYSQVRVFELKDDCRIPECPVIWHLVVSDTSSPKKLTFGAFPSFGSQTIVTAGKLKPGRTYLIHLGQSENIGSKEFGSMKFVIEDTGILATVED